MKIKLTVGPRNREDDEQGFGLAIGHDAPWIENVMKSYDGINTRLSQIAAPPPHDPFELMTLATRKNGYHSASLHIKKAMIVGKGFDGDPELLAWLKTIKTERGLNSFFQEISTDLETFGYAPMEVAEGIGQWALYRMPAVKSRVVPPLYDASGNMIAPKRFLQYSYKSEKSGVLSDFTPTFFDEFQTGQPRGVFMMTLPSICGNYWYGEPEYVSAKDLLGMNVSVVDYARKLFSQGMMADGIFIGKGTRISKKRRAELRQYMGANMKGIDNAHKIGFMQIGEDEEMQWIPMNTTIDRSFSDLRHDNRDEIVAAHMMPPRMVGIIAAGAIGGTGEVEGQLKIVKLAVIDPRQELYQAQLRELFRMMGAPAYDSFVFKSMDVKAETIMDLSEGVKAGWLPAEEAHDEWSTEKSALKMIDQLRRLRDRIAKRDEEVRRG